MDDGVPVAQMKHSPSSSDDSGADEPAPNRQEVFQKNLLSRLYRSDDEPSTAKNTHSENTVTLPRVRVCLPPKDYTVQLPPEGLSEDPLQDEIKSDSSSEVDVPHKRKRKRRHGRSSSKISTNLSQEVEEQSSRKKDTSSTLTKNQKRKQKKKRRMKERKDESSENKGGQFVYEG